MSTNSFNLTRKIFQVFLQKQTYLNMIYIGLTIVLGFTYFLFIQISLSLSWGLIHPNLSILTSFTLDWISQLKIASVVLGGVSIIPVLLLFLQLFVLPEQVLANFLLKENLTLDKTIWSKNSLLLKPWRLLVSKFDHWDVAV